MGLMQINKETWINASDIAAMELRTSENGYYFYISTWSGNSYSTDYFDNEDEAAGTLNNVTFADMSLMRIRKKAINHATEEEEVNEALKSLKDIYDAEEEQAVKSTLLEKFKKKFFTFEMSYFLAVTFNFVYIIIIAILIFTYVIKL
jgi:hypothetical protein